MQSSLRSSAATSDTQTASSNSPASLGQPEKTPQLHEQSVRCHLLAAESEIAGNDQLNLSARACGGEMQLGSYAPGPLLHAPDSKVPLFPLGDEILINAYPVIPDANHKIAV